MATTVRKTGFLRYIVLNNVTNTVPKNSDQQNFPNEIIFEFNYGTVYAKPFDSVNTTYLARNSKILNSIFAIDLGKTFQAKYY